MSQTLQEYIDWYQTLAFEDMYDKYLELHDPAVPGFVLPGNVSIPTDLINDIMNNNPDGEPTEFLGVESKYQVQYDDRLLQWAQEQFPNLKFVKCRLQIQKPGEEVRKHMDLLGEYLKGVCENIPWLKKIKHSLANPGVDLHQLLIACDDQVDGQVIGFHNPGNWNWKKGDILRINTWRSLHWTKNTSNKVRVIIKVTGIEFGMKKESNVIA